LALEVGRELLHFRAALFEKSLPRMGEVLQIATV
jgi:hypothetical protein